MSHINTSLFSNICNISYKGWKVIDYGIKAIYWKDKSCVKFALSIVETSTSLGVLGGKVIKSSSFLGDFQCYGSNIKNISTGICGLTTIGECILTETESFSLSNLSIFADASRYVLKLIKSESISNYLNPFYTKFKNYLPFISLGLFAVGDAYSLYQAINEEEKNIHKIIKTSLYLAAPVLTTILRYFFPIISPLFAFNIRLGIDLYYKIKDEGGLRSLLVNGFKMLKGVFVGPSAKEKNDSKEEKKNYSEKKNIKVVEDLSCKLAIIGNSFIGKSSLSYYITKGKALQNPKVTLSADISLKTEVKYGRNIKISIYDTGGEERFKSVTKNFLRDIDGIIIAYDVTDLETYQDLDYWIKFTQDVIGTTTDIITVIVGNKIDQVNRKVPKEEAQELEEKYGFKYFETSSYTGEGIQNLMKYIIKEVYQIKTKKEVEETYKTDNVNRLVGPNQQKIKISFNMPKENKSWCKC